jgi:hypothetical protein
MQTIEGLNFSNEELGCLYSAINKNKETKQNRTMWTENMDYDLLEYYKKLSRKSVASLFSRLYPGLRFTPLSVKRRYQRLKHNKT